MGGIRGSIVDKQTGEAVAARVQVLSARGQFVHPEGAILKVGPGAPFFYGDGQFHMDLPPGATQVLVERGTEYVPVRHRVMVPGRGTVELLVELERWAGLSEMGWHPGNTHIHYDHNETRPDERLRLDPRVEDLRVTAISILKRWELPYATNKYPVGVLTDFCSAHHHVECGEENRHNGPNDSQYEGYGHIMLLRIQEVVEPISRGYLVDDLDPDYPPLCYACDDAHRQGGVVIWCHNGRGLEAPVAAALGKVDAFNLFDPHWMDPEYRIWYAMLNCGFRLPASTGSDWFICSGNRVYAYTGGGFGYEDWMAALLGGRTFITNGPALFLDVDGRVPGNTVYANPDQTLEASVSWRSHYAIQDVEVLWNGQVVAQQSYPAGSREGQFRTGVQVPSDGWLAARLGSVTWDSFLEPIYAHTSPVYVMTGVPAREQPVAAAQFERAIDRALLWVGETGKFRSDCQRREVVELFRQGQAVYRGLAASRA